MGEVSEMMVDGVLCQECGQYIEEGEADGYPRFCYDCGGDPECNMAAKRAGADTPQFWRPATPEEEDK